MPETQKAFASGEVSVSRVKLLAQALALAPEQFAQSETALLAEVTAVPSRQVPRYWPTWKRHGDPEAAEAEVERLRALRALHLSAYWSGMVHLSGHLDPEGGLQVLAALRSLAEPADLDPADTRSPAQARGRSRRSLPPPQMGRREGRRRPAQVLVTIPWNTLQSGKGIVDTEAGPITGPTARRLTCDCTVSRVLLDPESVPIEMGRATRIIPARSPQDAGATRPGLHPPGMRPAGPLVQGPPHATLGRRWEDRSGQPQVAVHLTPHRHRTAAGTQQGSRPPSSCRKGCDHKARSPGPGHSSGPRGGTPEAVATRPATTSRRPSAPASGRTPGPRRRRRGADAPPSRACGPCRPGSAGRG